MSEALRLADALGIVSVGGPLTVTMHEAAAELRRLHALNAELVGALRIVVDSDDRAAKQQARAALAKVGASK